MIQGSFLFFHLNNCFNKLLLVTSEMYFLLQQLLQLSWLCCFNCSKQIFCLQHFQQVFLNFFLLHSKFCSSYKQSRMICCNIIIKSPSKIFPHICVLQYIYIYICKSHQMLKQIISPCVL